MSSITFPDRIKLIEELLYGVDSRSIDMDMAQIIYGHFQNKSNYYIEYEQWDDPRTDKPQSYILKRPNLWRFEKYAESSEQWKRVRNIEHTRRVEGWIKKANVKMVAYHIRSTLSFDEDRANNLAAMLVHKNMWGNIRALGVKKRITKEEEL